MSAHENNVEGPSGHDRDSSGGNDAEATPMNTHDELWIHESLDEMQEVGILLQQQKRQQQHHC